MVRDRLFALLALVVFVGFLSIVVIKLGRVDLTVVMLIGIALVCYDLWTQLRPRRR